MTPLLPADRGVLYLILNALVPLLLLEAGRRTPRRFPRGWKAAGVAALAVVFLEAFLIHRPALEFALFPWTDYPYFQGWGVWGGFFVFGMGIGLTAGRNRRALAFFALFLVAVRLHYWWGIHFGLDLDFREEGFWHGICLQSTEYTCTPAACATLLSLHGVPATEKGMARLCLTGSASGTMPLKAARGLRLATDPARFRVRVEQPFAAGLDATPRPFVASILLDFMLPHSVVVLDASSTEVRVADPGQGAMRLSREVFLAKWRGDAIFLEEAARDNAAPGGQGARRPKK